jgi:hypothetical protein
MTEERYSPTRAEWLMLNMQAKTPMLLSQMRMLQGSRAVDDVRVFFEVKAPDTVVVVIRHLDSVPGEVVKFLTAEMGREITELAAHHGWNGAIKTEWDMQ